MIILYKYKDKFHVNSNESIIINYKRYNSKIDGIENFVIVDNIPVIEKEDKESIIINKKLYKNYDRNLIQVLVDNDIEYSYVIKLKSIDKFIDVDYILKNEKYLSFNEKEYIFILDLNMFLIQYLFHVDTLTPDEKLNITKKVQSEYYFDDEKHNKVVCMDYYYVINALSLFEYRISRFIYKN
jgi:hypothetical protein